MIDEQKYLVSVTMESLYGNLKQDRMLSEKDASAKTPRITLRLFLYVPDEVNEFIGTLKQFSDSRCIAC